MKLRFVSWLSIFALLGLSLFAGCSKTSVLAPNDGITKTSGGSQALSTQRPLSDFLSAQGSTSDFFPPFPDYIAWTNNDPQTLFAAIDYTGSAAAYLAGHGGPVIATQVTGSVSERPLDDGRAEVTVNVFTKNALTWAVGLPGISPRIRPCSGIARPTCLPIRRSSPRCPTPSSMSRSRTLPPGRRFPIS